MSVPLPLQIKCVEREIGMRRKAYPRWIANGTMTEEKAHREITTMEAVLETLRRLNAQHNPELPL